jgi:ribose 5-phosphate isomerase B
MHEDMKIYIGADHRGFTLKETMKRWLEGDGYDVTDCGNTVYDKEDDFPDFSFAVADGVSANPGSLGIVICGSGGGVTMAANKVSGIRCGQAVNVEDVTHNRMHDDMNVLAIGSDFVSEHDAKNMVTAFLTTPYDGSERFARRLAKITARER